jgi:pyruvate-ferredoxin/flavodoxin oxidoreductase
MRSLAPIAALFSAESLASDAVFATAAAGPAAGAERVRPQATAAEAIAAAVASRREGRRVAVVLHRRELLGALDALASAVRARTPVPVHVVSAEAGPSTGHREVAVALDVGAGVLVSSSASDAIDLAFVAHRAAEDAELPFLHFVEADAVEEVSLPDAARAARFLGAPRPHVAADADEIASQRAERTLAARAPFALASAMRELGEITGRSIAPVERDATHDADEILVAFGACVPAARAAAAAQRAHGRKMGVLVVRALRPFFAVDVVKAASRARALVVLEPLDLALAPCGPLASALKVAFADALTWTPGFPGVGRIPPVVSAAFATLPPGGVSEPDVTAVVHEIAAGERARRHLVFGSDEPR